MMENIIPTPLVAVQNLQSAPGGETMDVFEKELMTGIIMNTALEANPQSEIVVERARLPYKTHVSTLPLRIASPSPARLGSNLGLSDLPAEKLDFNKVRQKAARRKKNRRRVEPGAPATNIVKGFQTPSSCGEGSDVSGASTPYFGPSTRNLGSVTSSPALRPATPQSGIGALRLQLDALGLGGRSPTPRMMSLQRVNTGSATSEAASDSDRTEMDSYEIPLDHDFANPDVNNRGLSINGLETPQPRTMGRKMTAEDFQPIVTLGKGAFGTVVLVKQQGTGRLFAQKQFKKATLVVQKKLVDQTKTERDILKSIRHPFIVKLYYAFQDQEKLYLILEYAPGGELFHHLSMERMFSEETAAFYMAEMVLALEHLHTVVGVIYRDLKPENCLLDSEGHLLLTDFGLSKVPVDEFDKCTSFMGTVEYMAPEVVAGKEYGMAVDWWGLGALGHDLLTGSPPFTGNNKAKVQQKILKAKLQLPYYLGPDAKDLLSRLLRKEPNKRLGSNMPKDLTTIKTHRFFKHLDWKKLTNRELEPPIQPVITDLEAAENFSESFTNMQMSPVISRKSFGDYMSESTTSEYTETEDPFGGFSFQASSSLLDSGFWDKE